MSLVDVSCAIILHENKVLVTQRGPQMRLPGKWEFPGGKVEKGEAYEASIVREIQEELNIRIQVSKALSPTEYQNKIRLIPFLCEWIAGEIQLEEHAAYRWLGKAELTKLDWAEADIPIVKEYISL